MKRNLPNLLTLARIGLIFPFVLCFFIPGIKAQWIALALYCSSAITDFFDGLLARRWQVISPLGRMLDPIADKLLVTMTIAMLLATDRITGINVIAALAILGREIFVSGLREFLSEQNVKMPSSLLAQVKTWAQMICLGFLIMATPSVTPFETPWTFFNWCYVIGTFGLWFSTVLTVYTGYQYVRVTLKHL